jgi:hypothetical protein
MDRPSGRISTTRGEFMSDDDPKTNDEPKTGFSILSEDPPYSIKLSYPMDDGRVLVVDLGLAIRSSLAAF